MTHTILYKLQLNLHDTSPIKASAAIRLKSVGIDLKKLGESDVEMFEILPSD